jgi:putative PIG3 family NAD(P)H quinone oxidoreductase
MQLKNMMKVILVKEPGGVDQLTPGEYPAPSYHNDELLVRVKATALNRADILQREGKYPPPKGASPILGLEIAGVVEEVGANCSGWFRGDRVCALLAGGGYAEYTAIPAKMAIPIPDNLSFEEAAAIPETFLTAYQALYWLGNLQSDQHVLIHAGASGVGTAAIQLVKDAGSIPLITAGSAKKLDFCLRLGAKIAINYRDGLFASHILEATNERGVNIILDPVGAAYWEQNLQSLAIDGRLILLATMGGATVNQADLRQVLRKRLQIIGTTLRGRNKDYKIKLTKDFVKNIMPGFADGRLKAIIDSTFSWEEVAEAHNRMESNQNLGKIVLLVD